MAKIGVVLCGCGVFDGAEIYESTLTLLALDRADAQVQCFAPDVPQLHVIDHLRGEPVQGASRNVLTESARLARGQIKPLAEVEADALDAVIFPGGFGAAKNLCTFAVDGPDCTVNPEVAALVQAMHAAGKPQGFVCIAPAIAAKVLGAYGVELTIGNDAATAAGLEKLGAKHFDCDVTEIHYDVRNRVATTPAYMLASRIREAAVGIEKLVAKVLEQAG